MTAAEESHVSEPNHPATTFVETFFRAAVEEYARRRIYGKMAHLLFAEDVVVYRAMRQLDMVKSRWGRF